MSERDRAGEGEGETEGNTWRQKRHSKTTQIIFNSPQDKQRTHKTSERHSGNTVHSTLYPVPSTRYPLPLTCYPLTGSRLNGDSCCRHCNLFRALDNASRAAHINKMIMKFIITAVLLCVCVCLCLYVLCLCVCVCVRVLCALGPLCIVHCVNTFANRRLQQSRPTFSPLPPLLATITLYLSFCWCSRAGLFGVA